MESKTGKRDTLDESFEGKGASVHRLVVKIKKKPEVEPGTRLLNGKKGE